MPPESPQLPPKPEVALALLQTAASVYVHLDPRGEGVAVPNWFKKQPQLVLQVGLNMAVPIPDLDVGREAISCTLSFNRRPEFCKIPWSAIYGLVGEDGRGMIWPESVPAEVASAADGRSPVGAAAQPARPSLRLASSDGEIQPGAGSELASAAAESGTPAAGGTGSPADSGLPGARPADAKPAKHGSPSGAPPAFVQASDRAARKRRELPSYLRVVK